MTRCFIAIDIDETIRDKIDEIQKELPAGLKLVESENLHITLKFLGEIDDKKIKQLIEDLHVVASGSELFEIAIGGCDAFPSLTYTHVILLNTQSRELNNLQSSILHCSDMIRKGRTSLHITLARAKNSAYKNDIADFISRNKDVKIGSMRVESFSLKKSTLTKTGPFYENIEIFRLGK